MYRDVKSTWQQLQQLIEEISVIVKNKLAPLDLQANINATLL